jgi:hypothetical protein
MNRRGMTTVSARVPNELAGDFELSAEINHVNVSGALREAMRAYVFATANGSNAERAIPDEGRLVEPSIDQHRRRAEVHGSG